MKKLIVTIGIIFLMVVVGDREKVFAESPFERILQELHQIQNTLDNQVVPKLDECCGKTGVLKTGQSHCWDSLGAPIACAGTGQDGELQKGAARSYTDNGDGTITDNTTGLMWEKLCDDTVNPPCPVINDVDPVYTRDEAYQKIADLNTTPCFANYCDWRLPNYNELQTLVHYGKQGGWAIDPAFDNGVDSFTGGDPGSAIYWSSTTFQRGPSKTWLIEFGGGQNSVMQSNNYRANVRAVRGR